MFGMMDGEVVGGILMIDLFGIGVGLFRLFGIVWLVGGGGFLVLSRLGDEVVIVFIGERVMRLVKVMVFVVSLIMMVCLIVFVFLFGMVDIVVFCCFIYCWMGFCFELVGIE